MGIGTSLVACSAPAGQSGAHPSDLTRFSGVDLTEYSGSQKLWSLQARQVLGKPGGQARLVDIHAEFWEGNRMVSRAVSPTATLDTQTHDVRMQGGIVVRSTVASTSIHADEVAWQSGQQELQCTGHVEFQRGPAQFDCQALLASRSLRQVQMKGPIAATLDVEVP